MRIKVGAKPIVVRAGVELESEVVGQLLPGAIVTVVEERVTPGHVRACVALDHMEKLEASGVKSSRGATFRSNSANGAVPQLTHRADGTIERTPPKGVALASSRAFLRSVPSFVSSHILFLSVSSWDITMPWCGHEVGRPLSLRLQ